MDRQQFLHEQFVALRREIHARQTRMFWIVVIGLLGVPLLTLLASDTGQLVWILLPYIVLVLIIAFLAEQNTMMRAGRYIREQIEPNCGVDMGWETWLESRPEFRLIEKHFFACFLIAFFAYYFASIALAIQYLWGEASSDPSGVYLYWLFGALGTYAVGAVWAVSTLIHHWTTSFSTTTNTK